VRAGAIMSSPGSSPEEGGGKGEKGGREKTKSSGGEKEHSRFTQPSLAIRERGGGGEKRKKSHLHLGRKEKGGEVLMEKGGKWNAAIPSLLNIADREGEEKEPFTFALNFVIREKGGEGEKGTGGTCFTERGGLAWQYLSIYPSLLEKGKRGDGEKSQQQQLILLK